MSTVRADNFGPSAGGTTRSLRGIAAAWANLDGTGTIALRSSFNISSAVDNGTGSYTINFTSAMANVNYTAVPVVGGTNGQIGTWPQETFPSLVGSIRGLYVNLSGSAVDQLYAGSAIHGDLA